MNVASGETSCISPCPRSHGVLCVAATLTPLSCQSEKKEED